MTQTTTVAKFNPRASVGSAMSLKKTLEAQMPELKRMLPAHVTPDRLVKTMMVAVNRNPKILECSWSSVLETVNRAGELGLDLSGTLGEAYPVPFKNTCQLIIGYRGLAKLARQSGEIKRITADAIYKKDHFEYEGGTDFKLSHKPNFFGERGPLIGFYSLIELKDGGQQAAVMTKDEVEKIRKASNSGNSPAWTNNYEEMGKKTVLRRNLKLAPMAAEKQSLEMTPLEKAIELEADAWEVVEEEAEAAPPVVQQPDESKAAALARGLAQEKVEREAEQIDAETEKVVAPSAIQTGSLGGDRERGVYNAEDLKLYAKPGLEKIVREEFGVEPQANTVPLLRMEILQLQAQSRQGSPSAVEAGPEPEVVGSAGASEPLSEQKDGSLSPSAQSWIDEVEEAYQSLVAAGMSAEEWDAAVSGMFIGQKVDDLEGEDRTKFRKWSAEALRMYSGSNRG